MDVLDVNVAEFGHKALGVFFNVMWKDLDS